jgi:hypothetical protein
MQQATMDNKPAVIAGLHAVKNLRVIRIKMKHIAPHEHCYPQIDPRRRKGFFRKLMQKFRVSSRTQSRLLKTVAARNKSRPIPLSKHITKMAMQRGRHQHRTGANG